MDDNVNKLSSEARGVFSSLLRGLITPEELDILDKGQRSFNRTFKGDNKLP